jgi:hypothetical protein
LTAPEKAVQLESLRAEYRFEVMTNGFDTDRAISIQETLRLLERTETGNSPAVLEPAGAPKDPASSLVQADGPSVAPRMPALEGILSPRGDCRSLVLVSGIDRPAGWSPGAGGSNPCGAYAAGAILGSFGQQIPYERIYREVTPGWGIGTGPGELVSFFQRNGHRVRQHNGFDLEQLAAAVERGQRMMLMVNVGSGLSTLHWVAVRGFRIDADGQRRWLLQDSFYAESGTYEEGLTDDELEAIWRSPIGGLSRYDHYCLEVCPEPPSFWERFSNDWLGNGDPAATLVSGLYDLSHGLDDTFGPDSTMGQRVSGVWQTGSGVIKSLTGFTSGVFDTVGRLVGGAGATVASWGADTFRNDGLGGKVIGGAAWLAGQGIQATGTLISLASSAVAAAGSFLGQCARTLGNLVGGAVNGIVNGIGGFIRCIGSLFRW